MCNERCGHYEAKADTHCVITPAMLSSFYYVHAKPRYAYKFMLSRIAVDVIRGGGPNTRGCRADEIDWMIAVSMPVKPRLRVDKAEAVLRFLRELQKHPVRCKDYVASTAHELVELVINNAVAHWHRLRYQHRRDSIFASDVFYKEITPKLPEPRELFSLEEIEFHRAWDILQPQRRARRRSKRRTGNE